jgi:uncharacterized protein YndB with AHSA1/START domain
MSQDPNDRIEKHIVLKAPIERVWRALSDAREFGAWFGVRFESGFEPGKPIRGQITTPGYEHVAFNAQIERLEAPHHFSMRWRPYAIDPKVDYSHEPMTLVTFDLKSVQGGTELRVVESGFSDIPIGRRAEAYRMNSQGWSAQCENIEAYLAKTR